MAALNFPNSPAIGDTWPVPPQAGLPTYQWDGVSWVSNFALGFAYVPLDGSVPMTGLLTLSGDPTGVLHAGTKQYIDAHDNAIAAAIVLRSYLAGLTLSTPGASVNFTVAPGVAADSTNAAMMSLAAALTKTTGAWVVGAGGALDTGAIAPNAWYHVYLIRRPDTGVVDVLVSLQPVTPTLPASYTQFRRIGSLRTSAASQWTAFSQIGDSFYWGAGTLDYSATPTLNVRTLVTATAPVNTTARIRAYMFGSVAGANMVIQPTAETDAAPSFSAAPLISLYSEVLNQGSAGQFDVPLDAVSQFAIRTFNSSGTVQVRALTLGWTDRRGRDA